MREDLGVHLRVGGEKEIEPVGPGIHERLHIGRALRVPGLQLWLADVEACAEVLPDGLFAFRFGGAAERGQVIRLDSRKVVLGLRIDRAEHGVGVGMSMHVRNAPVVAND